MMDVLEAYPSAEKLSKDLRKVLAGLTDHEARLLVDTYYAMQDMRIRSFHQARAANESGEPHAVFNWLERNNKQLEAQVKSALDIYTRNHPMGEWMRLTKGVGPVISAGLLAHIDIQRAPDVSHIYNFAGLNPEKKWGKGEKRPWNAKLKRLCWLIGESFVKVSGKDDAVYGQAYVKRKAYETKMNERGAYRERALEDAKRYGKGTTAYKFASEVFLPPGHIHERSKRWAVKMFLSHLHEVWHYQHFGYRPRQPYVIAYTEHEGYTPPPNTHLFPGFDEAERRV